MLLDNSNVKEVKNLLVEGGSEQNETQVLLNLVQTLEGFSIFTPLNFYLDDGVYNQCDP